MIRNLMLCLLVLAAPASAFAYECDTTVNYNTCEWVETLCYPEGYCDGYWRCDNQVTTGDLYWATYSDGTCIFRERNYNQHGQVVSCRRWCGCANPNDCDAKDNFNTDTLPCPAV